MRIIYGCFVITAYNDVVFVCLFVYCYCKLFIMYFYRSAVNKSCSKSALVRLVWAPLQILIQWSVLQ